MLHPPKSSSRCLSAFFLTVIVVVVITVLTVLMVVGEYQLPRKLSQDEARLSSRRREGLGLYSYSIGTPSAATTLELKSTSPGHLTPRENTTGFGNHTHKVQENGGDFSGVENLGCVSRRLSQYKPVDSGATTYNHPAVIQYAKLSKGSNPVSLTFMDYMAMMSAYKFLHPDKIVIHTYTDIKGKYFELARKWNTSVQVNKIRQVSRLNGKGVSYIQHQADFIKVRGLLEFGGVTSDFDVIIVNGTKLKSMQRMSECVLSREGEYVNNGFTSCIKNSTFVRKWLDGYYTDYQPRLWLHNASFKPAGILQSKEPNVCYNMYVVNGIATDPSYKLAGTLWTQRNGVNWRSKVAAHYFSKNIRQFQESALNRQDSIGELLRHVMDA